MADALERLGELREKGLLSDAEFPKRSAGYWVKPAREDAELQWRLLPTQAAFVWMARERVAGPRESVKS